MPFSFFHSKEKGTANGASRFSIRRVVRRTGFKVAAVGALVQVLALGATGSLYLQRDSADREYEAKRKAFTLGWLLLNNDLPASSIDDTERMRAIVGSEFVEATVFGFNGQVVYSTNPEYRGVNIAWPSPELDRQNFRKPRIVRSELDGRQFMSAVVPFYAGRDAAWASDGLIGDESGFIYTKIDITKSAENLRKLMLGIVAIGAFSVVITTLFLWGTIELFLMKRVRATAHYLKTATADGPGHWPAMNPGDEISAIERTVQVLLDDRQAEKKRLSDAETRLESAQIREAGSIAAAQSEVRQVKSLIEAMHSGMLTLDNAGRVLTCDDLAARRLGERPEAIFRLPLRAFLRREICAPEEHAISVTALNDWPAGLHRCRVVSPAGDGDAVEIVISDVEAAHGDRVVLIREAGDAELRQEIGELAKAIEQTMGPSAHNLGSLRERLAVLREYVAGLESEKQLVSSTLDRVPVALAVVDRLGSIRHLNQAAKLIIGANDGLSSIRGRLVAARREEQARLQRRLTELLEDQTGKAACWAALQVERVAGTPWLVLLTPLCSITSPRITATSPADLVIVMITDPLQPVRASATVLQQLHGLTPAESEVLGRLTDGMRLSDIAEDLGVNIETVRSQLKAVFSKTGTSRQAELVRYTLLGGAWIQGTTFEAAQPALADGTRNADARRSDTR